MIATARMPLMHVRFRRDGSVASRRWASRRNASFSVRAAGGDDSADSRSRDDEEGMDEDDDDDLPPPIKLSADQVSDRGRRSVSRITFTLRHPRLRPFSLAATHRHPLLSTLPPGRF